MHARAQIRAAVAALLGELQATGRRVYPSRVWSVNDEELPSLSVFTTEEAVTKTTLSRPVRYHRDLTTVIEGHALADEQVDDVLDQIASEVETAMAAALVVDGRELSTQLTSTTFELSGDGETQIGLVRLQYTIGYSTLETTPDSLG